MQDALGLIYLRAERPALAVAALAEIEPRRAESWRAEFTKRLRWLKADAAGQDALGLISLRAERPALAVAALAEIEPRRAEYWRAEFTKRLR